MKRNGATTFPILVLLLLPAGCSCNGDTDSRLGVDAAPAPPDGPVAAGAAPDANPTADGGSTDADPNPEDGFLTAPPGPPCDPSITDFVPVGGYSGGLRGTDTCGPSSPDCPTDYVPGNSGAPCTSAGDCTGLDPVCLTGPKYPGGTCAASGCELGSNKGCPPGDACINGGGQTYCVQGCGIHETGCFVSCDRDGYSCFTTESRSLGTCFGADALRQCDPRASTACTMPAFGEGLCVQTSWDDQSVGKCFEVCDPLAQDCTVDGDGCYAIREYHTAICFQSWGFPEGAECARPIQCAEGMRCACDANESTCTGTSHCRTYCATDGSLGCPAGKSCRPIVPGGNLGSCQPAS